MSNIASSSARSWAGMVAAAGLLLGAMPTWCELRADTPSAALREGLLVRIHDPNPAHLWNRLHSALFVREHADGRCFGHDELDPLLWPGSKYLVRGEHHKYVLALLDEFLDRDGCKLVTDPLKRAVLQHDLWAVFDWLANPTAPYRYRKDDTTPEARALQLRLARAIQRLELSAEQIRDLPDNYAAAIGAKAFARSQEAGKPDQAFLPPDLFADKGPWVLLGEHMRPAAPVHIRFVHGRSAFLVFLNLPAGREATAAYLEKLAAFPAAVVSGQGNVLLSADLPQFPVGTQVALVRQMMVIDDRGKLCATRLTESVQFRVYREIPRGNSADRDGKQDFHEFRMTRRDLFAGKSGGLHAVGPLDQEINFFVPPHPEDRFEEVPPVSPGTSRIMEICVGCHRAPGIHSVETYRRGFIALPRPPELREASRELQVDAARLYKYEDYSWGLLQGLMEVESRPSPNRRSRQP
jgi:hypothetical protein